MQRLDYHLTVQRDGTVQAKLIEGDEPNLSRSGTLNLAQLIVITKGYLPLLEAASRQTRDLFEQFGTLLYDLLFVPPVRGHFEELAWNKVAKPSSNYYLALSLTLQEGLRADIIALPWEFLYCALGRTFLATDRRVSFSRCYSEVALSIKPLSTDEPLRILIARLQPQGVAPVALTPISNTLNELAHTHTNLLKPYVLENPEPLEMEETLEKYRPHIVHLLIHGRFEDRGTQFALVDSSNHEVRWYGDRSLADLFTIWCPHLVMLQACEGGRNSDLLSFSNGGAWLVRDYIPAVIAMHYPITNRVGWTFAQTFYTHLVAGHDLDRSVQQARRTLAKFDTTAESKDDYSSRDFAAPILWMHPNVRQLFYQPQAKPIKSTVTSPDLLSTINLTIATPDGIKYTADVPADTLVDQLLRAFLEQWQPPLTDTHRPLRYSLRQILDRASTLREAGLSAKADLELVAEALDCNSSIRLLIKDDGEELYDATILINTTVRHLAEAFLQSKPGTGEVVVEWCRSAIEMKQLQLDVSLYDQGVNDDAVLRIYRALT